jgi:alpha-glucosidase
MIKYSFLILLFPVFFACGLSEKSFKIDSPSGNLSVNIQSGNDGITYSVSSFSSGKEVPVIRLSKLGLQRSDASFAENLTIQSLTEVKEISDSYTMLTGKQKNLAYTANEATLSLKNKNGQRLEIVFRVFDEGLAFRYVFPEQTSVTFTVVAEQTAFHIPEGAEGWMSPYEPSNDYGQPGYEKDYFQVKAGDVAPDSIGWAFPLLFKTGDCWLMISESDLDENYCGSHVTNKNGSSLYTIAFPEANERYGKGEVSPSSTLPWKMPWRFIVVGETVADVYESSMVHHLAEPSKLEDTSWIKPGRSSWEWWSSTSGRNVENLKSFIDLAAEMGWEYSLIDGGWPRMPEGSVEQLVSYANQKNVGLTIWYNSGGRRDSTQKDEDFLTFNPDTRDKELARIAALGIKGIKIDFFASDKQNTIKLYLDILRDAAKHKLLVNFHGCTLPRGWSRTYPNLMTMEAIKGAECYRYSNTYPEMAARFNTIAAIVRGAVGPTDYTPVTITDNKYPRLTTVSHELALAVVYESGIIHFADKPESYLNLPEKVKDYLKAVPATWDETRLLAWEPCELFVIARRKNDKWFIAGLNGKYEQQNVEIQFPMNFANATLIADGNSNNNLNIENIENLKSHKLTLEPNGGFVIY